MSPADGTARTFDLGPRSAWAWLTAGVALLALAETLALAALVQALLPRPAGYVLDVLIVVPTLGLLVVISSGLAGRIVVDAGQLRLHLGLLGSVRVPRADIDRAETFVPSGMRPVGLGVDVPTGSRQATVSRGGQVRFVRVLLNRPVQVRTALRRRPADELVMGTTTPDELVDALA